MPLSSPFIQSESYHRPLPESVSSWRKSPIASNQVLTIILSCRSGSRTVERFVVILFPCLAPLEQVQRVFRMLPVKRTKNRALVVLPWLRRSSKGRETSAINGPLETYCGGNVILVCLVALHDIETDVNLRYMRGTSLGAWYSRLLALIRRSASTGLLETV